MKFSSILKKINFKSRKSMLKTGAILFWTDIKRLFNWNIDNFKSSFLSRGQLGSKSNDKFFLSVLKMWQCCKYFFGNLIFALTARTLSGNRLNQLGLGRGLVETKYEVSFCLVWTASQCDSCNCSGLLLLTLSLPGSVTETFNLVLTFESVDEILWCQHSNETSSAVLSRGTTYI